MRIHTGNDYHRHKREGFTLVEGAIVLVVIGLIVGGIIVGKDLISAAAVRSQLSQLSEYQNAEHAFQAKYNCMPGDCRHPAPGFAVMAQSPAAGNGDGDEILQGYSSTSSPNSYILDSGETALFWTHLAQAGMIEGNFVYNTSVGNYSFYTTPCLSHFNVVTNGCPVISTYMPTAKIGGGNVFVYVYSYNGANYFGLSALATINATDSAPNTAPKYPGVTVQQASMMDDKVDDGIPTTGNVIAMYPVSVSAGSPPSSPGSAGSNGVYNSPTTGNANTCYDTTNSNGGKPHYSMEISGGSIPNCALSFAFQ